MVTTSTPAGPKRHPVSGNLPEFRADPIAFLTACAREHGDFVPLRLGPQRAILLNDPEDISYVLATTNSNYTRHFLPRLTGSLLGQGLFTSDGKLWQRERRLIQPAFSRDRMTGMGDVMVSGAEAMVDTWRDGETRDVQADMVAVTLDNVSRTLFGADVAQHGTTVADALTVVMDTFLERLEMLVPPPTWLPTPGNLRLRRAVRDLDEVVYAIIKERRASEADHDDVLSVLLDAQDETGSVMTDQQLRDEAMALFLGGHEPVAAGLSWVWYLLAQHDDVRARVVAELQEVLGGRAPTAADLPRLVFTDYVVRESMRLYPPSWGFDRKALVDCEIRGRPVKAGTVLIIMQWSLHRDPRWFERPEEFDPDRWADGLAKRLPRYAYLPFGGGPRACIGHYFATMEMILVMATVLPRFELALVPGHRVVPQPSITLRPTGGLPMVVRATGRTASVGAVGGRAAEATWISPPAR